MARAQRANGNFETWSSTSYSEPDGWTTSNQEAISQVGIALEFGYVR